MPLHLYASTPLRLDTSTPLQLYVSTPLHLYASTALQLYASTPLHLYASTTLHLFLYYNLNAIVSTFFLLNYYIPLYMLSILNFASSVTHRAIFYSTLITPISGVNCHFCLFGNFCFLPKLLHCSFLRFLLLPLHQQKNCALLAFCVFYVLSETVLQYTKKFHYW